MRRMRTLSQALLFAAVVTVLYVGAQIGIGYMRTVDYTPDIVDAYESVDYLQHEVAFGPESGWFGLIPGWIGVFVLAAIGFAIGKLIFRIATKRTKAD